MQNNGVTHIFYNRHHAALCLPIRNPVSFTGTMDEREAGARQPHSESCPGYVFCISSRPVSSSLHRKPPRR